jgi:PAS domain-containing protein
MDSAFDAGALERLDSNVAVIDGAGAILWVNTAWTRFARENGGGEIEARSYFDAISPPLREFYEDAFGKALATGRAFDQEYECSSADVRRVFHLRALPVEARALLVEHSLVIEGAHEAESAEAIEARYLGPDDVLLQCSHCRRVRAVGTEAWDWVREWVARPHPRTSHGICPSCVGFYWGMRAGK